MKLTRVEKQMLVAILVCVALLVISLTVMSKSLNKIQANGGMKAAVGQVWNGSTNSASTNR